MKKISTSVILGRNVFLGDFINLYGCRIGDNTKIGPFVEIQKNVTVGRNCKIQSHSFICEGVTIEDEAFVGHGVVFINDRYPRSATDSGALQTDQEGRFFRLERHHPLRGHGRRGGHRGRGQRGDQGCTCSHHRRGKSGKDNPEDIKNELDRMNRIDRLFSNWFL